MLPEVRSEARHTYFASAQRTFRCTWYRLSSFSACWNRDATVQLFDGRRLNGESGVSWFGAAANGKICKGAEQSSRFENCGHCSHCSLSLVNKHMVSRSGFFWVPVGCVCACLISVACGRICLPSEGTATQSVNRTPSHVTFSRLCTHV